MKLVTLALVLAACGGDRHPQAKAAPRASVQAPPSRDQGLAAFETIRGVLQHPRCQNCHPAGDAPLQGEDGHAHTMSVQRGADGFGRVGEACTACHGPANPPSTYGQHQPPGVIEGWHMPGPHQKLVFEGLAPGDLCRRLLDPAQNGGRDLAGLRAHMDAPLVTWGWEPGPGRAPVPTPRAAFLAAFETWWHANTPCPQ